MKISLVVLFFVSVFMSSDIYMLHYNDTVGNNIDLSSFKGKKIMIVNIATESSNAIQLEQLEKLYQKYHERLVVIGFPSNSFNNEKGPDSLIYSVCRNHYNVTFPLAQKTSVVGAGIHPIYTWLSSETENTVSNNEIIGDFQKFLINEDGQLIGVFSPSVAPGDPVIENAIVN